MRTTTYHLFSVSMQRALLITLCVFATSITNAFEATINGLVYDLTGVSAKVVSVASGNTNTYIEIPEMVEHEGLVYTITDIGSGAFCNYNRYHYYYVDNHSYNWYEGPYPFANPRYSTEGVHAAANSYVRKIKLPKTILKIGAEAFYNTNITDVEMQDGIITIESGAFNRTRITTVTIPASVTYFGENGASIFEECDLLRTIIYRGSTPPTNWVATSNTYVPSAKNYVSPTFRINSAQIIPMISWNESEFDYNGLNPMTSWTNNMNEYNATLNMPALNKNVGDYDVEVPVTFTKGGEGFTVNCVYSYTINPLTLTAKVQDEERVYADENPIFKVEYSGFVNGENESVLTTKPTITTTATAKSDVGAYPITINDGVATNYNISYEPGTLTVNKAPLTITVSNETRVYGGNNPNFILSYEGLKNGETVPEWITRPAFSTTATQKSDVGTYTVSATCEARNYDVTINDGNLNITPASLTIKANNTSRLYFAENPEFTYSYRGFMNNDNASCLISAPKIDCDATIGSKAGEYVISVYGASAKNYNITYEDAMLTIDKRTLVVTPNNAERIYGEENPEFTADITGFVNNETDDVISEMPTIYTNAKQTSDVGNYEILAKDGSADNYIFTYKKGTLTIDKADQTITWEQDLTGATVGDQIELSASSSSGLTIEYVIDSDIVSPYNVGKKLYLDCLSEGTLTIKALQSGGTNYNPAVRVVKEMVISERNGTVPHNTYQDVNQDGNVDSQDVLEIYDYMQKH